MKYEKMRLEFCIGDGIVIVFVSFLAIMTGICFQSSIGTENGNVVVIYREGEKFQELSLKKNAEVLIINDYTNRVVVKDGKAAIVESDCPGEDCVHSGWIEGAGRSLVCLPNCVEIRIEGKKEVDFMVK